MSGSPTAVVASLFLLSAIALSGQVTPAGARGPEASQHPIGQSWIEICHVPPGNPTGTHTIKVAGPAIDAHLAHGDAVGPCPGPCPNVEMPIDSDGDGIDDSCGNCPDDTNPDQLDSEGPGVFHERQELASREVDKLAVIDLDEDGDYDLVFSVRGRLSWSENLGPFPSPARR